MNNQEEKGMIFLAQKVNCPLQNTPNKPLHFQSLNLEELEEISAGRVKMQVQLQLKF
jgi:hypothetical protein